MLHLADPDSEDEYPPGLAESVADRDDDYQDFLKHNASTEGFRSAEDDEEYEPGP